VIPQVVRRPAFVAAIGCLAFLLIGWSSLLVPSLVPEVEARFRQSDAGLGLFYFLNAAAYAGASVLGGLVTERVGRRSVLVLAAALHAAGLVAQGGADTWALFTIAGLVRSLGAGALDGGVNGLAVDLYAGSRGRALNLVHLFFALGALGAPFAVAARGAIGVSWEAIIVATGLATVPLVVLLAVSDLADGRRRAVVAVPGRIASSMLARPMLLLGLAIGCYVAGEIGVSSWLVRFLAAAPAGVATSALGLYWAGLTVGRLVAARFADRFDHAKLGIAAILVASVALVAAIAVPSLELSIALFTLVGFASGPIYPLIMAIGGERFPDRGAAMTGTLGAAAVLGSLVYPPLMGVISVTAGLPLAMLGTAAITAGGAVALLALGVGRATTRRARG
jgi:fucose permease